MNRALLPVCPQSCVPTRCSVLYCQEEEAPRAGVECVIVGRPVPIGFCVEDSRGSGTSDSKREVWVFVGGWLTTG